MKRIERTAPGLSLGLFLCFCLMTDISRGEVLNSTQSLIRIETTSGSAKELFAGSNKVQIKDATGNPMRNISNLGLLFSHGIVSGSQVDLGVTYSTVDVGNGNTLGGVSELVAKLTFQVINLQDFDLDLGTGFRTPGDNRTGDDFVALSDGLTKYDVFLSSVVRLGLVDLSVSSQLTNRNHPLSKSQMLHEFSLVFSPTDRLQLATGYQLFSTAGGFDIGGAGFTGNFSQVKEEYTAVSVSAGYLLNPEFISDFRFGQKLNGKNTDLNTTVALGLTYRF